MGTPGVLQPFTAIGLGNPALANAYGSGIPSLGAFALASSGALGSATPGALRGLSNVLLVSNLNEEVIQLFQQLLQPFVLPPQLDKSINHELLLVSCLFLNFATKFISHSSRKMFVNDYAKKISHPPPTFLFLEKSLLLCYLIFTIRESFSTPASNSFLK